MSEHTSQPDAKVGSRALILRRADQLCLAVVLVVSFVLIGWFWYAQGLLRGRLIDVEIAEPLVASFQVDINSAEWPEWILLPGVGESLARRIVEFRHAHGPFDSIDDLRRVSGLGPKTLAKIRPYLQIGSPPHDH